MSRLDGLAAELTRRALEHARGLPADIRISIDAIDPATLVRATLPPITTVRVANIHQGREGALAELVRAGVDRGVAERTIALLANGAHPDGDSLRGALLIDAASGVRLEPDPRRGVRATRMDLAGECATNLRVLLATYGLDNDHVREALVLAGKVALMPGYVAELCWSDDPDYRAGYVCSPRRGYVRFPHLKELGDPNGGRAFFVSGHGFDLAAALAWLEETPVLFEGGGEVRPDEEGPP